MKESGDCWTGIDKIPMGKLSIVNIPGRPKNITRVGAFKTVGHIKNNVEKT